MSKVSHVAAGLNSLNLFSWKTGVFIAFAIFCLLQNISARAAIIEMQPFNFGQWAITNNTGVKFITVNPDSSFASSPGIVNFLIPPTSGMYRVDSLPPNTAINSVTATQLVALSGGNQIFTMDTFQIIHDPSTNASGEVNITLGMSAKTSGNSVPYDDAVYSGTVQLEINY